MRIATIVIITALGAPSAFADEGGGPSFDAAVSARRFEQQVKSKVGDPAGERLVEAALEGVNRLDRRLLPRR